MIKIEKRREREQKVLAYIYGKTFIKELLRRGTIRERR